MDAALADLDLVAQGKVRDIYDAGEYLLMVASDRISVYDVVLPDPIPDKGKVLTGLSVFWFYRSERVVPNHLVSAVVPDLPPSAQRHANQLNGRFMLVRRLEMFPVECVVRGYLSGSGWREYQQHGSVCGIDLPAGLRESERLPQPIFTPATKAERGEHDENIDFERAVEIVGDRELMDELRRISLAVYALGAERCQKAGIILADTKFELGRSPEGAIVLGDEVLTPDSSRFWPAEGYAPGRAQPSFDKQFVRDYADSTGWDHSEPGPELPQEVIQSTRAKYVQAFERISGQSFESWLGR